MYGIYYTMNDAKARHQVCTSKFSLAHYRQIQFKRIYDFRCDVHVPKFDLDLN